MDIEKELLSDVSSALCNAIDLNIVKSTLGYKQEIHELTFIDKRYDYPQQRVTLRINIEITPFGDINVTHECNRTERTFEYYVRELNNLIEDKIISQICGDVPKFKNIIKEYNIINEVV